MTTEGRKRTITWDDPVAMAASVRSMSGSEFLDAWLRGDITPPITETLDYRLVAYDQESIELACTPAEFHFNPYGVVHGGPIATLLDTAAGCVVHAQLPAGTGYVTLDLQVRYLRAITLETGPLRCIGRIISLGRRVATSEATILDAQDRKLAHATSTCLIIPAPA